MAALQQQGEAIAQQERDIISDMERRLPEQITQMQAMSNAELVSSHRIWSGRGLHIPRQAELMDQLVTATGDEIIRRLNKGEIDQ